uniref:Uncharacterized protein n=1 Tax=viral metagenome TaxID=1070528 RepID=A0A6C0DYX5_9ZZZZ
MLTPEYPITKPTPHPPIMPHLEYFYDPPQFYHLKEKLKIKSNINNIMRTYWNKIISKSPFFKYYSLCCYKILTIYGGNHSIIIIDDETKQYFDEIIKSYNYITYFYSNIITKTKNKEIIFDLTYFDDCETFYNYMAMLKNNLFEYKKNIIKLSE